MFESNIQDEVETDEEIAECAYLPHTQEIFAKPVSGVSRERIASFYRTHYNVDVDVRGLNLHIHW